MVQQQKIQQQQQQPQQSQPSQQPQQNSIVLPADYANKYVPIQITLPAQAGSQESGSRVLSIQVPSSAIQGLLFIQILLLTIFVLVNHLLPLMAVSSLGVVILSGK